MASAPDQKEFKIVLLGQSGVGKTSMVLRFVNDEFHEFLDSTLGACHNYKTLNVETRPGAVQPVRFSIWDTAGQERYAALASLYYRSAAAAIIVYDVTNKASLDKLHFWVKELKSKAPPNIVIALAGNKTDLGGRKVDTSTGAQIASEHNAIFEETSCKTSEGVKRIFEQIGVRLLKQDPLASAAAPIQPKSQILQMSAHDKPAKKGCC